MSMGFTLTGGQVLTPEGLSTAPLSFDTHITFAPAREVDLSGFMVLPGIVDIHGDGFERHLAPRRGAMKDLHTGLIAAEAELAANGITTATLAQFYSWEGGMRGAKFARGVFEALEKLRPEVATELTTQLRFEVSMLEDYDAVEALIDEFAIPYIVFNDHLPHKELAAGKRPPRLTGQALRIGSNPAKHLEFIQSLHARMDEVPAALDGLCARLLGKIIRMGSHDETTAADRETWRARGVTICEFPMQMPAVEAAHHAGEPIIMGAPNVVRGGSHNGNVSAADVIAMGMCTALASDYHYPSIRRAAFFLADCGLCDLASAWALISSRPAQVLGLTDRGDLREGQRADMVIMDAETRQIEATIVGGQFSLLRGRAANRFLAARG